MVSVELAGTCNQRIPYTFTMKNKQMGKTAINIQSDVILLVVLLGAGELLGSVLFSLDKME